MYVDALGLARAKSTLGVPLMTLDTTRDALA